MHSMRIDNKIAGQGFKVYTLCHGNYIFGLRFTSKPSKIDGLNQTLLKHTGLPKTSAVCVQLMEQLQGTEYVCYLDNYFTRVPLLLELRKRGYGACGTSKKGSGIQYDLVTLRELSKKQNEWGIKSLTTVEDKVLCISWQDNNTVLFMSTAHTVEQAEWSVFKDLNCRKGIPDESGVWIDEKETEKGLLFPVPINDYNTHMGGSDGNAQQRAMYTAEHHHDVRYWWPLFRFLVDASIVNAFILYRLEHPNPKQRLTHHQFRRHIALALLRNPLGQRRKRPYDFGCNNPSIHPWTRA